MAVRFQMMGPMRVALMVLTIYPFHPRHQRMFHNSPRRVELPEREGRDESAAPSRQEVERALVGERDAVDDR